jgi:uncharacterized protein (DUF58 family)
VATPDARAGRQAVLPLALPAAASAAQQGMIAPAARRRSGAPGSASDLNLERLFGRIFAPDDSRRSLHVFVDASLGMSFRSGAEAPTKFRYARRIAAALGYVALARYGHVSVASIGQAGGRRVPLLRSREDAARMFQYLEGVTPGGHRDFSRALLNHAQRAAGAPGVCVLISDFLDPNWERAVRALFARRFRVVLLHVLDPEEAEPTNLCALHLVDAVSGASRDAGSAPQVLERYRSALASFCGDLSEAADKHGMEYARLTTNTPFEGSLLRGLRGAGLLR